MKYARIVFTSVLSILLIVFCAFLPDLMASFHLETSGQIIYGEKEPISLQIRQLTYLEKLACMLDSQQMFLSDENANIPREELFERVAGEMRAYQDADLISHAFNFRDEEHWTMEADLVMFYNKNMPDRSAVLWLILMTSDYYGDTVLQLILDNETGALMLIDFTTSEPAYSPKETSDALMRFYIIFLDRLGIPQSDLSVIDKEPVDISKIGRVMEFGWTDEVAGPMGISFQVYERSFSVVFGFQN